MAIHEFNLTVVSPMFLNGADTKRPELRAASVRGQLRYWLRAYLGAQTSDLKEIWEEESAVFGSTGQGSAISIRLFGTPSADKKYPMLPHREGTQETMAFAIEPDETFTLQIVSRLGVDASSGIFALRLWSLLGGMGKRSRRMMGAVQIYPRTDTSADWYEKLTSPSDLKNAILGVMPTTYARISGVPVFPILHPDHSWILIGSACDDAKEANQDFFRKLLRNPTFKPKSDVFGYAKPTARRASSVIAQVRRIGNKYYPVITAFRSNPIKPSDDSILRDFMKAAMAHYSGIHVWGGW